MATRPFRHARRRAIAAASIALASLLVWGPSSPGSAQTVTNPWLTERRVLNLAHGGGLDEAPQGTLYAYKTAMARGANSLEMDLHITRDGHVVAIHDSTVDRTTNGSGCVATKTLAELKALDAAHTFVPGRGPVGGLDPSEYPMRGIATGDVPPPPGFTASDFTIATLEEIFQAEPDALMVMELKPTEVYQSHDCPSEVAALPPGERPDLAAEVARLIDAYDMTDKVMVASFIDDLLHRFMTLAPDVDTSFPLGESVALYAAYAAGQPFPNPRGHEAIQVPRRYGSIEITEDLVHWARENGVAVHFWTINDPDEMQLLLDWGADGLITDRPSVLAELLPEPVDPTGPQPPSPTRPEITTPAGPGSGPTTTAVSPTTSTTTSPSTTSSTAPGSVPGSSQPADSTVSSTTAPPPGGVGAGGAARPRPGSGRPLARTGAQLGPVWVAVAMLATGAVLAWLRRRRLATV